MPIFGLGLHIFVALYFAIHALRSGQPMYWLFVLFSFPLLGSIVYFVVIWLPDSRVQHGARNVARVATRVLDPGRELRAAREAFDYTPTAQNQMRLALALLEAGQAAEAASAYQACLQGPFAADREIRFCAARAFVEAGQHAQALTHLQQLRQADAGFRAEQVALLTARALAATGQADAAQAEFEAAGRAHGSFECLAEHALWALDAGREAEIARLLPEIDAITRRWNRHNRALNLPMLKRLEAARKAAGR